jgi:hypothetical protein
VLDETERPIPNFEPTSPDQLYAGQIPPHLYDEWWIQDTSEAEEEDPERYADSMRPGPVVLEVPEDQFLSALGATVVHRNVSIWQALQIWRKNNRRQ